MGIAKSIEAYTTYDGYSTDTEIFIKNLSEKLDADFLVNTYNKNYDPLHKKDRLTTFMKPNKYKLTITFFENIISNKPFELPTYELTFPINYIFEDSLTLIFYPNNTVQIMFLTFEHLWAGFIETLKFRSIYENRQQAIKRYETLRNEYKNVFGKLNIRTICIITHAYYETENIGDIEKYHTISLPDILQVAKEKDNLHVFDLVQIFNTNKVEDLDKEFVEKPELQILLIDHLNQN